jgi:hypothetical protein
MSNLLEKPRPREANPSTEIAVCHYVKVSGDQKSMCGLDRETICRGCPYSDYAGMHCKCGRELCPLCQLALEWEA